MKRPNIYLPMAALILAALAIPAAAQQQVPFKGTFQGSDRVPCPPTASICTTATGTGTHLGNFSFKQEVTVGANLTDTGSAHWIAAPRGIPLCERWPRHDAHSRQEDLDSPVAARIECKARARINLHRATAPRSSAAPP